MTLPTNDEMKVALDAFANAACCFNAAARTGHDLVEWKEKFQAREEELIDAIYRATLASLLPSGEVLEAAVSASDAYCSKHIISRYHAEHIVRAAATLLLADKEREIEATRNDYGACYAAMCKAQDAHRAAESRVAALEAGVKPFALAADSLPTDPELQDDRVGDSDLTVRDFNLARTLLDGGTR